MATFYYKEAIRLSWLGDSPNITGALLAFLVLIWASLTFRTPWQVRTRWVLAVFHGVSQLVGIWMLVLLVLTYSRGAFIGFVLGLTILGVGLRSWRIIIAYGGCLLIAVVLVKFAGNRFAGIIDTGDPSILNRLLVWKAALGMLWDYWLMGVGSTAFAEKFLFFYQPLQLKVTFSQPSYYSPINIFLNIGVKFGVPTLCIYLAAISTIFEAAWRKATAQSHAPVVGVIAALGAFYMAGNFTNLFSSAILFWGQYFVLAGLLYYGWQTTPIINMGNKFLSYSIWAVVSISCLAWVGNLFLQSRFTEVDLVKNDHPAVHVILMEPRNRPCHGLLLYFPDYAEAIQLPLLRAWVEQGVAVAVTELSYEDETALEEASQLEKWAISRESSHSCPLFLAGLGRGGRLAVALAENPGLPPPLGIVLIGSTSEATEPGCSPVRLIGNRNKYSILILHGSKDQNFLQAESEMLLKLYSEKNYRVSLLILPHADHDFLSCYSRMTHEILQFIEKTKKSF